MPDKRIIEHTATTTLYNDDYFLVDRATTGNDGGTRKIVNTRLKQLFGGNNFAGEWHSGITYTKEAYVTHEGKLYHNIKGTSVVADSWTSSQWTQVSIGNELRKIVESLASTFDTSTNYSVDDLVIYNNTLYKCIVAHTAGTWISSHFTTVKVSSLLLSSIMDNFTDIYWENYSGSTVNYTKGTVIHKGLNLYRCKANTTNQSWDNSKWEQVDVTDLLATEHGYMQSLISSIAPTFSSSAQYGINDFVIYNYQLYICIKPHHGSWYSPDFSIAKIGEVLEGIFHDIADVYSPSGSYVKGDVVNYLGVPLRCIVDTATSPMVFSEWEQVTVAQLINEKVADVQIAGQTTVDENHISDLTSLAIEGTASGEIASFSDGSNLPMRSFVCDIDAVQDLHGYDAPWVGGAGKNKLPMTVDGIKTANTTGTWNENVYTVYGMTFTVNTDDGGNVTDIEANGTPSSFAQLTLTNNTAFLSGSFIGNGCPSGGGGNTYRIRFAGGLGAYNDFGSQTDVMTADPNTAIIVYIRVDAGATVDHLKFYPMLRLATETDPTFAPYSNICPISGHTGVDAWVRGKNLAYLEQGTISTIDGSESPSTTRVRTNYISVQELQTYIESSQNNGWSIRNGCSYDINKTFISSQVYTHEGKITIPSGASYIRLVYSHADTRETCTPSDYWYQFEIGETATTYEPYNPNSQTIQVSWQTEAGEVFGGYVDLVSGVLTVDRVGVTYSDIDRKREDGSFRLYPAPNNALVTNTDYERPSSLFICDKYRLISIWEVIATTATNIGIGISNTSGYFYIKDAAMLQMTLEEAQTYLSSHPIDVVYPLAEAQTYQLTPTQIKSLLGKNNAWCDTGDVNVKYNKDATTVINSLIARIEALENA